MTATDIDRDEQIYWLALRLLPGLGTRKAGQLIEHFDSARKVFRASVEELEYFGLPSSVANSIAGGCTFDDAVTQQHKMLASGTRMVALGDPFYPKRLRMVYDPPPVLFARGRLDLLHTVSIGVVGTRRPSAYGTAACDHLSRELALAGATIASGMARGIDTTAHRAALDVTGNTIAVLGCGVDLVYPAENRKLADEIASKGLLLSEFPMGTPAYPQNFPIRNRIVSGLSAGILVVEGARYSGSAITARLAIEQGRELFAVPGNITNKMSWGPNLLIKEGAKLVQEAEDILSELCPADRRALHESKHSPATPHQATLAPELDSPAARDLLASLRVDDPADMDTLIENLTQYSTSELIAALFELEMMGLVRQLAGKKYIKVW